MGTLTREILWQGFLVTQEGEATQDLTRKIVCKPLNKRAPSFIETLVFCFVHLCMLKAPLLPSLLVSFPLDVAESTS